MGGIFDENLLTLGMKLNVKNVTNVLLSTEKEAQFPWENLC